MAKHKCSRCGKILQSGVSAVQHIAAKHGGKGHPVRMKRQESHAFEDDDESMASRAVQAEIDIACGFGSDDDWLLP